MTKRILFTLIILLFFSTSYSQVIGQYNYGQIHLQSGFIIEGKDLSIIDNQVSLKVKTKPKEFVEQSFVLEEIDKIYFGKKKPVGLFASVLGIIITEITLLISIDYWDIEDTIIPSILVGTGTGLVMKPLLYAIGVNKYKWTLIYSDK